MWTKSRLIYIQKQSGVERVSRPLDLVRDYGNSIHPITPFTPSSTVPKFECVGLGIHAQTESKSGSRTGACLSALSLYKKNFPKNSKVHAVEKNHLSGDCCKFLVLTFIQ